MGLRSRSVEFVFRIPRHIRNGMLWGVLFAGVLVLFFEALEFPQVDLAIVSIGLAFITAGGIGAYMMFATKEISEKLYADMAGISGKIDTMSDKLSGKIDTMSDKLSGKIDTMSDKIDTVSEKIDTMSDKLSGKIDTVSEKIDTMSDKIDTVSEKIDTMSDKLSGKIDDQTDILKDIRDALVRQSSVQKPQR